MAEEWRKIEVRLDKGGLEAYLTVPLPAENQVPLTEEDARRALKSAGVIQGLLEPELARVFAQSLFGQEALVARGQPPVDGQDGKIEFLFDTRPEYQAKEDQDGRIDYREISFLVKASKGQELCRRIPPTEGRPGASVSGKPLAQRPSRDTRLPIGPNTEPSPTDPDLLLSTADGCVTVNSGKLVEVKRKLEIKGDVDFNTGNIDFNGSLQIGGDVKSGFKVKVTGDLEVGGCVEDAEVEAGGSILVKKGLTGHGKGTIRTGGDLTIKYVQGQNIICGGSLILGGELMHAHARVNGDVTATSSKGAIIGGVLQVKGSVDATQLGTVSYTHTEVMVGCDFTLQERLRQLDEELGKILENADKVKRALYQLSRLRLQLGGQLPAEQQALFQRLQDTGSYYPKYQQELTAEREGIEQQIAAHKEVHVTVRKSLHPGVKVTIGKFSRAFSERVEHTTLREVHGEIAFTA